MRNQHRPERSPNAPAALPSAASIWEHPVFEVIPLDCEITSYAPDGDGPLF
jgi:hypothetical protein